MQEKGCQIVCFVIEINNKKHVIMKNFDNKKNNKKDNEMF